MSYRILRVSLERYIYCRFDNCSVDRMAVLLVVLAALKSRGVACAYLFSFHCGPTYIPVVEGVVV